MRGERRASSRFGALALGAASIGMAVLWVVWPTVKRRPPSALEVAPRAPEDAPGAVEFSIFFTADVRGRTSVLARRATLVDRQRARQIPFLQVDAGDLIPMDAGNPLDSARLVLAAYARMGVDAVTVGESEIRGGPGRFEALARETGVSVVAANLLGSRGERVFPAGRLVRLGRFSLGVLGVVELPAEAIARSSAWGVTFTDAVLAAREEAGRLRLEGAVVVVGLFNVAGGANRARQIAAGAGIDVVVLGREGEVPSVAGQGPIIASLGSSDAVLGRIDAYVRGEHTRFDAAFLPISEAVPEQVGVAALVRVGAVAWPARGPRDSGNAVSALRAAPRENWAYASTEACAFCHLQEVAQWRTTAHAHALRTLNEAHRGRASACLGCHTTGFLQPGGTQYVDTALSEFPDVGCECCHGPSGTHVASVDKRKGTSRKVDDATCFGCHAPDQSVEPFDVARARNRVLGPGHGAPASP